MIPKRSYSKYNQPHKYASTMRTKTSSIRQTADTSSTSSNAVEKKGENSYVYRPGMIPQCRQMFYQVRLFSKVFCSFSELKLFFVAQNFSILISLSRKSKTSFLLQWCLKRVMNVTVGTRLMLKMKLAGF